MRLVKPATSPLPKTGESPWLVSYEEWLVEVQALRPSHWPFLLVPLPLVVIGSVIALLTGGLIPMLETFLIMGSISYGVSGVFYASVANRKGLHREWMLRLQTRAPGDVPPDRKREWRVEVDVVQDGWISGRDRGVMWVEGHVLYFLGRCTSFALGAQQIGFWRWTGSVPRGGAGPLRRQFEVNIRQERADAQLSVEFDLEVREIEDVRDVRALAFVVQQVASHKPAEPLNVGQIPPTAMGPGAQSLGDLKAIRLGRQVVMFCAGLLTLVGSLSLLEETPLAASVVLIFGIPLSWFCWRRFDAARQGVETCRRLAPARSGSAASQVAKVV